MKVNAEMISNVSKKGNPYIKVEIQLTETYKKVIFLDDCEQALVKATYNEL